MLLSDIIDKLIYLGIYPNTMIYFVPDKISEDEQFYNITSCDYCFLEELFEDSHTDYYRGKFYESNYVAKNVVQLGNAIIIIYF